MAEIFNCWQCKYYSVIDNVCRLDQLRARPDEPICERFVLDDACKHDPKLVKRFVVNYACKPETKITKKKVSASSRIALIGEEIKWLRLDPACHDRMVSDSLSTIETMLKHLSATIKNTERDFEMEVISNE